MQPAAELTLTAALPATEDLRAEGTARKVSASSPPGHRQRTRMRSLRWMSAFAPGLLRRATRPAVRPPSCGDGMSDRLAAALTLPEDFDCDRFDRLGRPHALSVRRGAIAIVLRSS